MRKSRLSKHAQKRLVEYFLVGATARSTADVVGVNKNTVAFFFHRLRLLIYNNYNEETDFSEEVELDESYFGGVRKGKRGRGAAGKIPVFGILKRGGKVSTVPIENAKSETLLPIIKNKVKPDSIVYTDHWKGYDVLDVSEFTHKRINHSKEFVQEETHINGVENFWNQAKRHMRKFNGIPKEHFYLYLKECEWRFNVKKISVMKSQILQWLEGGF